ncbi:TIGR02530 family flagellar biosynthesis protein [Lederbergia lenta]|uniref:Flagellar operon protein n=1 Tax=Lederbergia lenta TaxID=1467 RepID=A0A2X4WKB1_LEDLE|nr:TIGR02530 family flagellar biosynthesis protein [Lederbergia lenta]MCM3110148.1 flagellar protein [Lederbergia lenta]MEC2324283.1 TIGR02530 family flagellar biosynthesis protein [Lederbergia lenta]SQI60228.1 flagellar operon protein [Lederbergia lenta]
MGNNIIHKLPSQPITIQSYPKKAIRESVPSSKSFSQHLEQASTAQTSLKISKHAGIRMDQRQIDIGPDVWEQIGEKVDEAKRKGVNDSLVLIKNAALIVNTKNSTVVTVMDRKEAGKQIFTKIDGTIIMD